MAIDKETRILKSNTIEQFRQKANEVSLHLGDTDQLNSLIANNVFDYSNVSVGTDLVQGSDDNSLIQKFNVKPDESLDNTGGYIILKGSPTIPSSFVADAVVTQSGGFSATIVSVSTSKILVKNSSGTFNAGQNLVIGSDNIANSAVVRLITESYNVGNIRVFKNGTELPQDLSANGFHVPTLSGVITLQNNPALAGYEEGTTISQSGGFSATVLKATSTALFLKVQSGTYSVSQNITGGDAAIIAANHTGISSKDIAFGNAIELNTITANASDDIQIKATSTVQALNELQNDIGNIANLGTTSADDLVVSINELETGLRGTLGNYTVTTTQAGHGVVGAVNELHSDIGTASFTSDLPSHTTYNTGSQNLTGQIENIATFIGDTAINNIHGSTHTITQTISKLHSEIGNMTLTGLGATTLSGAARELRTELGDVTALNTAEQSNVVGAINEIEGVFDASANKIISSPDFTIDSESDIILDVKGGDVILNDSDIGGNNRFGGFTNFNGGLIISSGSSGTVGTIFDTSGNQIVGGDISLNDNFELKFGASSDLKIYHNASDSYVDEVGTGNLLLRSNGLGIKLQVATGGTYYDAVQATAFGTTLLTQGAAKFSTDADGVNVTGQIDVSTNANIAGNLDVDGTATIDGALDVGTLSNQFTAANRNNVKLALNELHSELGNAVITGTNTAAAGLSNLTAAINAIDAEIGVTNTILNSVGTHGGTTVAGVLGNLSTAIVNNDTDISTLNTFKTNIEAREIATGNGLTGGGDLSATRTLSVDLLNNTGTGTSGLQFDSGKLKVNDSVLRTNVNRTIASGTTLTINGALDLSDASVTFPSAGGSTVQFGTSFIEIKTNQVEQGLKIDRTQISGNSGSSVDAQIQFDDAKSPDVGWEVVYPNGADNAQLTSSLVTFDNAGGLVDGATETGISVGFGSNNFTFAVQVDDSTIEVNGSNQLQVKAIGTAKIEDDAVTFAKMQHIAQNRVLGRTASGNGPISEVQIATGMIATNAVTNAKIANPSITIGDSTIALGGTDTTLTGLTDIDLTSGDKTIFDGVGANDLTIGASSTTIKIPGNLTVEGTTTSLQTTNLDITDKNILLGKGSTNSANNDGTGITFGEYGAAATFNYSHSGTKLVANKSIEATSFIGNASTATQLASGQNFSITGDITAAAISFNGTGPVELNATIDDNTVDVAELNVNGTPGDGKAIVYQSGPPARLEWATLSTTDTNTKYGISAVDGDNADEEKIRITSTGSDAGETDDVVLEAGTGLSIARSGDKITYTNSAPDQTVSLTGAGATTVSGTYPNFTITSTDNNTQLSDSDVRGKFSEGEGIDISAGGVISGEDATTTNKGIASFNTNDFSTSSGAVSIKTGGVSNNQLAGSIANGKLANSSITINGSAISLGGSVTTPNTMGSGFVLEDGDGTEVTITEGKEVKFKTGGSGEIEINWTDTTDGTDADPYDLQFSIADDGITNAMLADNCIATAQVINGAITLAKIQDIATNRLLGRTSSGNGDIEVVQVQTDMIAANAVSNAKLANSSVSFGGVSVALGASDATPAFNLTDATNVPAGQLTGTVANARLTTNNVTNASVSGTTLTLTRQGSANVAFTADNYGSFSVTDGNESDTVTSGQSITFAAGTGLSVDQTDRTVTYTPTLNAIRGVRLEAEDGSLISDVDETGLEQRITLKEGNNIDLQNSGGEIIINGPHVNNAANLDSGTLPNARINNDLRGVVNFIGSTAGNTFINFNSSSEMTFTVNNQLNALLDDNGDFMVRGDLVAVSSNSAFSDERLKEDIHKVEGALDLVSQLDGVTFKWKKDGKQSAGVIAQNVEKVLPSAVREVNNIDNSDTHKVVDYNQLSALLIEAIKELKEQNKELKDEIEVLKNINSNS